MGGCAPSKRALRQENREQFLEQVVRFQAGSDLRSIYLATGNADKVPKIDGTLDRFRGREEEVTMLPQPCPAAASPIPACHPCLAAFLPCSPTHQQFRVRLILTDFFVK